MKPVGTIKVINGNTITLAPDSGPEMTIQVDAAARIVRVEPGQKDLKNAIPMQLGDLQVGDRILVRGKIAEDGRSVIASGVIAMKHTDVAAKQERDREEWQRHGTGGLVTAVDPPGGTITISGTGFGAKKSTLIRISKDTIIRRYAPGSAKPEDATISTINQIKIGDQLHARGTRGEDGTELKASEILAGTFPNIQGTVISTDTAANIVQVMDATTKKSIVLKVSANSQLRKLSPETAQKIAMELKGEVPTNAAAGSGPAAEARREGAGSAQFGSRSGRTGFQRHNGSTSEIHRMLNSAPEISIAALQKGDAVIIVSTEGSTSGPGTAINLWSGAEPILAASPKGGQAMVLSPWTLGGGGAEESQ